MKIQDKNTLIKSLLEAGVHFGHHKRRWNPKMAPYIFGEKENIYIIDLQKSADGIIEACNFLNQVAQEGGYILFVGTKKQAQDIVMNEAMRCGMFYVQERWLGGTLTNFQTIRKSVSKLDELETMRENGTFKKLSKKEVSHLTKEINRLKKNLEGIRKMERLPKALFIIDPKKEETAVREANRLSISVVALVDTNCDPDLIDYVIPGNDDAIKSIKLITSLITDAILEGRDKFLRMLEKEGATIDAEKLAEEPLLEPISDDDKIEEFIKEEDIKREEEAKEKKMLSKPPRQSKKRKGE